MTERPGREPTLLAEGFHFLEGPRWREGRLYASDFYDRHVWSFTPDGTGERIIEVPGQPSGLGFDPQGRLLVVSMLDQRLLRWEEGTLLEAADLSGLAIGPANDMVVDEAGGAYVGSFGVPDPSRPSRIVATNLVRVEPDGSTWPAATGVVFPNGVVITPDGRTLLVAETFAARITAFDRAPDGSLSGRRVWADFGGGTEFYDLEEATERQPVLPDGMTLDAEGCLWVADAKGKGAMRVREGGEVIDRVDTGDLSVFALTLGGVDRRTLFLCAAPPFGTTDPAAVRLSALFSCAVDVPGAGRP
ncbi:SMP-30/gluconolactonase/LRE family protein [Actinoallomurus acaciae]|uniref:SMP-30/gluconolactonase/LRE family protein n=1 Tax=Actinoallomurus acaciae TaxID=502577 RepID=A0ABV5YC64_9ACTN